MLDIPILKDNLARALRSPRLALPSNYLVFDLETTDLEFRRGVIWQIGLYPVMNGVPVEGSDKGLSFFLETPEEQLRANKFEINRRAMRNGDAGDTANALLEQSEEAYVAEVKSKAVPRQAAFRNVCEMMQAYIDNGWPIVGQNLVHFDIPFFEYDSARNGSGFKFPVEGVVDVGILIKAAKLQMRYLERETLREFFNRVYSIRAKGVFFAIEKFCVPYWGLEAKYGVDLKQAHAAGYDCWITSLILQEMVADALSGTVRADPNKTPKWGM
jgi:hypothetical protein